MIKNLVFEGGGVLGIAYGGAILELENNIDIDLIENYSGTSAGSIVSMLLSIGYSGQDIIDLLLDTDFKKFRHNTFGLIRDLIRLFSKFGWNKGKNLEKWLENCFRSKGYNPKSTFKELYDLSGKKLYITGTNVTLGKCEVFSVNTTPDMSVLTAVRISASIPFYYCVVKYNSYKYVDGALLNNYPISIFDNDYEEDETLGFRIDNLDSVNKENRRQTGNLLDFTMTLISIIYDALQNSSIDLKDWNRTIRINCKDLSATNFDITKSETDFLILSGRLAVTDYIKKLNQRKEK